MFKYARNWVGRDTEGTHRVSLRWFLPTGDVALLGKNLCQLFFFFLTFNPIWISYLKLHFTLLLNLRVFWVVQVLDTLVATSVHRPWRLFTISIIPHSAKVTTMVLSCLFLHGNGSDCFPPSSILVSISVACFWTHGNFTWYFTEKSWFNAGEPQLCFQNSWL